MNGYLLDTHSLIWWVDADRRLSETAVGVIGGGDRIVASDVSLWEGAIKVSAGKLQLEPNVATWFARHVGENRFAPLPIRRDHLAAVAALPRHHRDPFDRLLVVQAIHDGLTVITNDRQFDRYDVPTVW